MGGPVKYALAPSSNPLRRRLDPAIGALFLLLRPGRALALARGEVGAQPSILDRMMIAALAVRHERAGTLGDLAALHRRMWEGEEGVKFHAQAEKRFRTYWADNFSSIVEPLRAAIAAAPAPITALCEIGCGSGLVLQDLAGRLPELTQAIGLDLSPGQIARNRERFAPNPRLRFEAGDATVWVPANAAPGWAYLTNSGVLEYLGESEVRALFAAIADGLRPAVFALIEPIADDYDLALEVRSRPYNFERSLGHNYPRLLGETGWVVRHREERRIEGTRMLMLVAAAF